jgi:tape measure domain-containing protein
MAELRLEISADSLGAENSIKRLRAEIRKVTDAFEKAEIGSQDFIDAASDLSVLDRGLKASRNAVVDLEKAYKDLGRAVDDMQKIHDRALKAGEKHHRSILDLAEESFKREDSIRDKNYKAELDDWDRRLNAAVAARKKIDEQQKAIMEFRAGMGARGAIPGIASPIEGGINIPGSPSYAELGSLNRLRKELQDLQAEASRVKPSSQEWAGFQQQIASIQTELRKADQAAEAIQLREDLGAFGKNSLNAMQAKLRLLKIEANNITPDVPAWKALNKEIQALEKGIQKVNRKPLTMGQRAGAAGGAFLYGGGLGGGVGSAVGGIAGGLMRGVPGAFAGAAIGQVVDNLGAALAGITSEAAAVMQMQRGLAMASVDAKDFAEAQSTVASMSERLLMPLEQTTRLFAQLRVNTKQYNLSVQDTAKIMEGTALAIMATGGSSEDLEGAMRAVVQIMSKGGVQAEELRGQLGERFPGAVVKFAQANKLSFEELQQGLEQGQIGIKEFVAFAEKNYDDYAEFSKQLATAPEFAGKRLQIALEGLGREVGNLFAPIGAEIQNTFADIVKTVSNFVKENRGFLKQMISDFASIIGPIAKVFGQLLGVLAKFAVEVGKVFQGLFSMIRQSVGMATIGEAKARLDRARAATAGREKPKGNVRGGGPWRELSQAEAQFKALGGEAAWKKANAPVGPTNLTFGGVGAGMSLERTPKDTSSKERTKEASNLNRLIQEELELQNRLGNIGKDELSQIEAKFQLAKEILALTVKDLRQTQTGQVLTQSLTNATLEYKVTVAELNEEWDVATGKIADIGKQAEKLRQAIERQGDREETPFQKALFAIEEQATRDIEVIDELLGKLKERGAFRPETLAARAALGDARALVTGRTPEEKRERASKEVTKTITEDLKKQLFTLQNTGTSFSTLDKIIQDLGDTWNELSPNIQADLANLANQVDAAKPFAEIANAIRESREELERMSSASGLAIFTASTISNAFGNAFKGLITGSMTAQEALGNMFQSIADSFADMVAQMIAEWMKMQVLGIIKAILGPIAGGFSFGGSSGGFGLSDFQMPSYMSGVSIPTGSFASGGIVTGPTLGLVGEGRYNEAIVPLPDGKSIPVELNTSMFNATDQFAANRAAMNGSMAAQSAASPFEANRQAMMTAQSAIASKDAERTVDKVISASMQPMKINYETQVINNVEYVTSEQFQRGMNQAAEKGRALTMGALKNSVKARRQIGI